MLLIWQRALQAARVQCAPTAMSCVRMPDAHTVAAQLATLCQNAGLCSAVLQAWDSSSDDEVHADHSTPPIEPTSFPTPSTAATQPVPSSTAAPPKPPTGRNKSAEALRLKDCHFMYITNVGLHTTEADIKAAVWPHTPVNIKCVHSLAHIIITNIICHQFQVQLPVLCDWSARRVCNPRSSGCSHQAMHTRGTPTWHP